MVIIGVLAGRTTLSLGVIGQDNRIKNAGLQLQNLLELAHQQAQLEPSQIGVSINEEGYKFYRYKTTTPTSWKPLSTDLLLKPRRFPNGTQIQLRVNGEQLELDDRIQIIFYSNGNTSNYQLNIGSKQHQNLISILAPET